MRKGKWAGLTAVFISKFMGCSSSYVRKRLTKLKKSLDRELTLYDIGGVIYEYRKTTQDYDKLMDELSSRWTSNKL